MRNERIGRLDWSRVEEPCRFFEIKFYCHKNTVMKIMKSIWTTSRVVQAPRDHICNVIFLRSMMTLMFCNLVSSEIKLNQTPRFLGQTPWIVSVFVVEKFEWNLKRSDAQCNRVLRRQGILSAYRASLCSYWMLGIPIEWNLWLQWAEPSQTWISDRKEREILLGNQAVAVPHLVLEPPEAPLWLR